MSAHAPTRKTLAERLIENPHLLGVTLVLLIAAGASSLLSLPRIEDPRIVNRNALVITSLPGASATRVEALVSKPIETALRELSELKSVESTSRPGISLVTIELDDAIDGTTNEAAFTRVRDKLDQVSAALPTRASTPRLDDDRGAVAYSLIVSLAGLDRDALGVTTRMAEELADRLRSVGGTELVRLYGAVREEITVAVDRAEVSALGLHPARIADLLAAADARQPSGALRDTQRDLLIEVDGEFTSIDRIAAVPLTDDGSASLVRLGDIAEVSKSIQHPPSQIALADGVRAVLVAARVEDGVRLSQWTARSRDIVERFAIEAGANMSVEVSYDQSRYTDERLSMLSQNLLGGALLVLLVVLIGLGWRAALVVGAALPLSAAATLFGLSVVGQSIHQMSIFGMIIAVGLLIDNAIVVADRVAARIGNGASADTAVRNAVHELKVPLMASTSTTVLGFMPVFLLPGNVGDFVSPIAISVILALIASFAVATTLIAALAGIFLTRRVDAPARWWQRGVSSARLTILYRRVLHAAMMRPLASIALAITLPVAGLVAATTLEMEFFPSADRDQFEIEVRTDANSAIAHTAEVVARIDGLLRTQKGIQRTDWTIGASYPSVYYNLIMNQDGDPRYAHGIVTATDAQTAERLLPRLQRILDAHVTDAQVVVGAFGQGPPIDAPVEFRIVGPNATDLVAYGEQLRRILQRTPGVVHSRATVRGGDLTLRFEVDEARARLAGLTLAEISRQLDGALEGALGGILLEDVEALPVRVRYRDAERAALERIETTGLAIGGEDGERRFVPANALGRWITVPELSAVTRRNGERVNTVLATVAHGVLPISVAQQVENALANGAISLAPGYRIETGGSSAEQGEAVMLLARFAPVLGVLMVGILVLSFRSTRLAAAIGVVAALSAGLGMLSLTLAAYPLGFNPLIGSAGLVGVAINGSIVVLAALNSDAASSNGDLDAMVEVTIGATRHILATTLTTVGGFMPLLLFMEGSFWPPLAVVIAGGVGLSVTLSLLFTPAVFRMLVTRRVNREARAGAALPAAAPG